MLDYPAIFALAAVVREGSFERAARALHLTPSAVSQRVRQLEDRCGRILVRRGAPCTATQEGHALLRHAEAVGLMEQEVQQRLPWLREHAGTGKRPLLRIGVNADSLASWFVDALTLFTEPDDVLVELVIEDQEHTLALMREGQVLAAVAASGEPLQGFEAEPLGTLRYLATASPAYIKRHFPDGVSAQALAHAPALRFNAKDELQEVWLARHFGADLAPPSHWIASSAGFVDAALAGIGWGMNPQPMVSSLLAEGRLQEIEPGRDLQVALWWHCACRPSGLLKRLGAAVRAAARTRLEPQVNARPDLPQVR